MLERIKTAIVLLIIVGFSLFATSNPIPVLILITVMTLFAAHEWTKIMPSIYKSSQQYIFILVAAISSAVAVFVASVTITVWLLSACMWLVAIYWVSHYPRKTQLWFHNHILFVVGCLFIAATSSSIYYLWQQSPWWLFYAMALVWCADSGAYFVGRKFGKTKLAPSVSPKKTYEGLLGGIVLSTVISLAALWYVTDNASVYTENQYIGLLILSVFASVISVLGDLFESMLKRKAGIKDSGNILPGHGGVLDRVDSLMITLPIFSLGFLLLDL